MEVQRIFVQGAGTMGSGIAQVSAQAGYEAVPMDLSAEFGAEKIGNGSK